MFLPILGDVVVDYTGDWVVDGLRVPIVAGRAEDRLPYIELLGGAAMRSEHQFSPVHAIHSRHDRTVGFALRRSGHFAPMALDPERVSVVVEINHLIRSKIDWIGTEGEGIVEIGRIEDL